MKIKKLIGIFEQLIPYYQKAIDDDFKFIDIKTSGLYAGLCNSSYLFLHVWIFDVFEGYYKYLVKNTGFLYELPSYEKPLQGIQERIDFMKSEIKSLNKLLKQGYTDV